MARKRKRSPNTQLRDEAEKVSAQLASARLHPKVAEQHKKNLAEAAKGQTADKMVRESFGEGYRRHLQERIEQEHGDAVLLYTRLLADVMRDEDRPIEIRMAAGDRLERRILGATPERKQESGSAGMAIVKNIDQVLIQVVQQMAEDAGGSNGD